MKVLIELDDDVFKDIKESNFDSARAIVRNFQATFTDAIRNGTPIADNATNGDMVKAVFSNIEIVDDFAFSYGMRLDNSSYVQFNKDWWNAPYKGV